VLAVSLEVEDRINHVLQHARASYGAFLRDVANQEDGDAGVFCLPHQLGGAGLHLADRSGRALQPGLYIVWIESTTT